MNRDSSAQRREALPDDATHILVVDDDQRIRDLIARFLFVAGYRVSTASAAQGAPASMRGLSFDLVILDINLPGIDGFEVLRRLRRDGLDSAVPIIAVSANAMPYDIERGNAAGFTEYHTKPLRFDDFLRAVSLLLGGSRS